MKGVLILIIALLMLVSCNNGTTKTQLEANNIYEKSIAVSVKNQTPTTGIFSTAGLSFKGNTNTQYYGDSNTDHFAIICQQGNPYALLQVTFFSKADATGFSKPSEGFYAIKPGHAHISLSGVNMGSQEYSTKEVSTGTIETNENKLFLKNVTLFSIDGDSTIVNATLNY